MKRLFFLYAKCLKRKKLYYFIKLKIITLILKQKNNRTKKFVYNENTFNRLYNDYTLRTRKKEKLKNNYFLNESELYPFTPRFTHSGYFVYPNKIFPSVNNFGKKYYYSNNEFPLNNKYNCFNNNYTKRRNITEDDKNYEENNCYLKRYFKNNTKNNLSSRINKNINDQLSQYLNNFDISKRHNFLNKTNPNIENKFSERQSFIKSSKSKTKNQNKNSKISNKLLFNSNKSLNPSSLCGLDQAITNYTNPQKNSNNNIKSVNNILSNINSVSSRINEANNNSHFLNGIKMISGNNEFFYDFNSGNRNINNNEQKTDLSIQSLSDSKIMELAGKYVNEDDNSSENYQMNNILHNKKRYKNKVNQ